MRFWNDCKTIDDLWEAALTQHMIICITRSGDCDTNKCRICGWNPFNKQEWQYKIEMLIK